MNIFKLSNRIHSKYLFLNILAHSFDLPSALAFLSHLSLPARTFLFHNHNFISREFKREAGEGNLEDNASGVARRLYLLQGK